MKTPTLEEVKEYFKNAKEVKSADYIGSQIINIENYSEKDYHTRYQGVIWLKNCALWDDEKGYAEIISYKDTYTVSKDFILQSHKDGSPKRKLEIENEFKELFPKVELEVGKWYKSSLYGKKLYCFTEFKQCDGYLKRYYYGFQDGLFCKDYTASSNLDKSWNLATKEEVETALINEAKKRGFKEGVNIIDLYNGKEKNDCVLISSDEFDYEKVPCGKLQGKIALRDSDGSILFVDGKWAEIISEPIELTLEQIAEKFGVEVEQIKIKK